MTSPRILLISLDPLGERMVGAGIRTWELGHALAPHGQVTLAAVRVERDAPDEIELVEFSHTNPSALRAAIREADVIFAPPQLPVIAGWLRRSRARVIYDLYDPAMFETLELFSHTRPWQRRLLTSWTHDRLAQALASGDAFVCASETQRDLWLGSLLAIGRIAPDAYDRDRALRRVLGVVPFGLPAEPPARLAEPAPLAPELSADNEIILWNGGIWNWLDPVSAVEAVALLHERRRSVRLVFMGQSDRPAGRRAAGAAREAAAARGLLGSIVLFNENWVPYEARADWLRAAACAVSINADTLESRFAFRTRILDCLWAGVPVVCTAGDALAERVSREDLGAVVAPGDPPALAAALEQVLERGRGAYQSALRRVAAEYVWPRVAAPLISLVRDDDLPALGPPLARPSISSLARTAAYLGLHRLPGPAANGIARALGAA